MKIKIAIPDNPIYRQLFFNAETVSDEFGIELIRTSEKEVANLFKKNMVNVAFISPIDYGQGAKVADYRIVPANVFAVKGYSRLASIFFKQGLNTINTCGCPSVDDFIFAIGKILLAERYSLDIKLEQTSSNDKQEILDHYDSAMLWKKNFVEDNAMDITEDWFDSYSIPLVIGSWVVRHEEEPEGLERILKLFESDSLHNKKEVTDKVTSEMEPRSGEIIYKWSDEIEQAYDTLLEILFYHQFTSELASVKMMGVEIENPATDSILFGSDKEEDENQ